MNTLVRPLWRVQDDYGYTTEGIVLWVAPPQRPKCGTLMDHSG